jgi:hypothetical protein
MGTVHECPESARTHSPRPAQTRTCRLSHKLPARRNPKPGPRWYRGESRPLVANVPLRCCDGSRRLGEHRLSTRRETRAASPVRIKKAFILLFCCLCLSNMSIHMQCLVKRCRSRLDMPVSMATSGRAEIGDMRRAYTEGMSTNGVLKVRLPGSLGDRTADMSTALKAFSAG